MPKKAQKIKVKKVETPEQMEIRIKIEDLMTKRKGYISEIKMLLFKFSKYYQNIDSMDKLGLLEPQLDNSFGSIKISGLGVADMAELDRVFKEILDVENNIRELKTRSMV